MSKFKSYADVENSLYSPEFFWGSMPSDGKGFPAFIKLDGANSSVWLGDDGTVRFGKRSCEITTSDDNFRGLRPYILARSEKFKALLDEHPTWNLFGEWLVKHSINYPVEYYNNWYCFDVYENPTDPDNDPNGKWISFHEYFPIFKKFGLEDRVLQPVCFVHSYEEGQSLMEKWCNEIKPYKAEPHEEGIVIKNYAYMNRFHGEHLKIKVEKEVKQKHEKTVKTANPADAQIATQLHDKYVTEVILEKNYQKLIDERNGENPRMHFFGDFLKINNVDIIKDLRKDPVDNVLYEENKDVKKAFGALMTNTSRVWFIKRLNLNG